MKNIGTGTKNYIVGLNVFKISKIEIDETYITAIKQGIFAGLAGVLCILGSVILWLS